MTSPSWPYGNPYASVLFPVETTTELVKWAPTGHRRNNVCYPGFVDAKRGDIIVSECDSHRLQVFDCFGNESRFEPFGRKGHYKNEFLFPGGVTTTACHGANVVCADTGNRRVVFFSVSSGDSRAGGAIFQQTLAFGQNVFSRPMGVELDTNRGSLWVADEEAGRVTLHTMRNGRCTGELRPHAAYPLISPIDVAIDDHSRVYVTDSEAHCVQVFDCSGQFLFRFGSAGSADGQLCKPWGICFDRQFRLFVSDQGNNRVQMFTAEGRFLRVITNDVYIPKGISITVHENLVVATSEPYDFLKLFKYQ